MCLVGGLLGVAFDISVRNMINCGLFPNTFIFKAGISEWSPNRSQTLQTLVPRSYCAGPLLKQPNGFVSGEEESASNKSN